MERVWRKVEVMPSKDYTLVDELSDGGPLQVRHFAQLIQSKENPMEQAKMAFQFLERFKNRKAKLKKPLEFVVTKVLESIPDQIAKEKVEVWCLGNGIATNAGVKDPNKVRVTTKFSTEEEEFIRCFEPHFKQVDLAKIMVLKKYQEADERLAQTLVFGTYRLLDDYYGPRRHYKKEVGAMPVLTLPDLPPELYQNGAVRKILFQSQRLEALAIFNRSVSEGFEYLEDVKSKVKHPFQGEIIDDLTSYFKEVDAFWVSGFSQKIAGTLKDLEPDQIEYSDYPSFHQKEYAYRLLHKQIGREDYLIGDTGTMKTGASIYATEAAGAKTTLVVCPPSLRTNWEREIREKYQDPVDIARIETSNDLSSFLENDGSKKPRYIIIGYSLLSRLKEEDSIQLGRRLKEKFGLDSLIVDEAHLAKEYSANCTQALYNISKELPEISIRIAMTATAIVNSVEDLDAPVRILLPQRYTEEGSFTKAARNEPMLVAALLDGQELVTRWSLECILGAELPPVEYKDEAVPLSFFHQALYDFVYSDDTVEDSAKRGLLRQVALDPLLIRRYYYPGQVKLFINNLRERVNLSEDDLARARTQERIKALEERFAKIEALSDTDKAVEQIFKAYQKFQDWKNINPASEFNENFLVRMGYENVVLWAFFVYPNGLGEIIKSFPDAEVRDEWKGKDTLVSSKYVRLFEKLDDLIPPRNVKVIIYSGFYTSGVTTGLEDYSGNDNLAFLSLFDHLRANYGDKTFEKIDGTVSIESKNGQISDREKVRRLFRLNPNTHLLASMGASRLGIDLTIPKTDENKNIEKIVVICLDRPDTFSDLDQAIGRVRRKTSNKLPIEVSHLKATQPEQPQAVRYGLIDNGIWESLEYKRLLSQYVLDGVPLTVEEEEFLNARMSRVIINTYPTVPKSYLYRTFFSAIRGAGYQRNKEFLRQIGFEGMTNADFFAYLYPQIEDMEISGFNASAVSELIKGYIDEKKLVKPLIASIGAGASILQYKLGLPVLNLDMIPEILASGRERQFIDSGGFIVADASALPIASEVFDITDASLMLHWTQNLEYTRLRRGLTERIKTLLEIGRVSKMGGYLTFTFPHSYLSEEQFLSWQQVLENNFGLRLREDMPSGLLRATDFRTEEISWIFNLEKFGEPDMSILDKTPVFLKEALDFEFEKVVAIIDPKKGRLRGLDKRSFGNVPIVHRRFEIADLRTNETEQIFYHGPVISDDLEDQIRRRDPRISKGSDLITLYGMEEFELYRWLSKEIRGRKRVGIGEAEGLAISIINQWFDGNGDTRNNYRTRTGLLELVTKVV